MDLAALSRLESCIDDLYLPWIVDLVPVSSIDNEALLEHIRGSASPFTSA